MIKYKIENKIPVKNLRLKTSLWGITMEVSKGWDGEMEYNVLEFGFSILRRSHTIHQWRRIKDKLESQGPRKVTVALSRYPYMDKKTRSDMNLYNRLRFNRKRSSLEYRDLDGETELKRIEREYFILEETTGPESSPIISKPVITNPFVQKDKRTGAILFVDSARVSVRIPMMFTLDFVEEFDKIVQYRKYLNALLALEKSRDRITTSRGGTIEDLWRPGSMELKDPSKPYTATISSIGEFLEDVYLR